MDDAQPVVPLYELPDATEVRRHKPPDLRFFFGPGVTLRQLFAYLCPAMTGIFYILLFWLLGTALSRMTGGYISGNIIGMILLFGALCLRWVKAETVRPAAKFLLGAMALFFVPFGVGLMESYREILGNLGAIVVSGIVSTIVVLAVAGWTYQSLNKKR